MGPVTPINIIQSEDNHLSVLNSHHIQEQQEQCKQQNSFFYHEESAPNHQNETIHIISPPYTDHTYFTPKQIYQRTWPNDGQVLSLDIDQSSLIYPHPAPLKELHPHYPSHHLPLSITSPCSPQSIADATMTELTELSPVF